MRILGVDPGLRITGYGVLEKKEQSLNLIEAGVIQTNIKDGIAGRLQTIYEGIDDLLKDTRPNVVVLEKLYSDYRHPTTAILMGHARGVVCLAAGISHIPLVNIASTRVKKSVLSNGHATKQQVNRAVQGILGLGKAPKPLDVSDALAIAISYAWMNLAEPVEAIA